MNAATKKGWTALMSAAQNDYYEMFDLLIKRGADVNAIDIKGRSAKTLPVLPNPEFD